jgi:MSHA biogenesis protein MshJ
MKAQLSLLLARIDSRSLRERALLFLVLVVLLSGGASLFLLHPLQARAVTLVEQVNSLRTELALLEQQVNAVAARANEDPDEATRSELQERRAEFTDLHRRLREVTEHLVPPEEMAQLLEALLTREAGLRLARLEGLGTTAVLAIDRAFGISAAPKVPTQGTPTPGLFRHGLRIHFTGPYLDTLAYLRAVEALPWQVLWESVVYRVTTHPHAEVTITVYSLSLDEGWIGV